ncbi:hypothetical protein H0H92_014727 [Tricholoma furcatifolium]|nr:hypothetical protein H0H92_014727 [Tricholoma furcatifolium]
MLKGERYVNTDFCFATSLQQTELINLVVSYDIACQWSINLWERMKQYPADIRVIPDASAQYRFLIPKFHLPGHILACQTTYSFNFNSCVGRTDGEGIERGWAHINPIATSTREMGPGARRDTLDDHFGDWNWKKTTLLGISMLQKIKEAVTEANERQYLHDQFEAGLIVPVSSQAPVVGTAHEAPSSQLVNEWKIQLEAWENDHSKPNPYEKEYTSKYFT